MKNRSAGCHTNFSSPFPSTAGKRSELLMHERVGRLGSWIKGAGGGAGAEAGSLLGLRLLLGLGGARAGRSWVGALRSSVGEVSGSGLEELLLGSARPWAQAWRRFERFELAFGVGFDCT